MTREQRAKQFMPFDAMKGLKEALAVREERHSRVDKRELSEDTIEALSETLSMLVPGMEIEIEHYRSCHDVVDRGRIQRIDLAYKYLMVGDVKIFFTNIYDIKILET